MSDSPRVSVILVNYKGADDTLSAIDALTQLPEFPENLEIVVVDNASGDDSLERLHQRASEIVLVASPSNTGFAGGCNLGVQNSRGVIVAFLNNDAKPDAHWVSAAMESFDNYENVGAVASQVLNWEGTHIDYAGAGMTWYGMGYRPRTGDKVSKKGQKASPVLFGTGSAMFVRRDVFDQLGGFDESFFMFFEDVDFGWRLNLAGYTYLYEPRSMAFHRYHGSMGGIPKHREQFLLERNALYCLYKNLDDAQLQRILPGALLASVKRAVVESGVDTTQFDLSRGSTSVGSTELSSDALAPLFAMDQFVDALPELMAKRADIQRERQRSDAAIWRLFGETNAAMSTDARYLRGYDAIVEAFGVTNDPPSLSVLIVTGDPIGKKLSGPGIRAWHMADALSASHDVTVVSMSGVDEAVTSAFRLAHIEPGDDKTFSGWESWADVIIFQGHAMELFPSLRASTKHLIVDIYDPMHLEQLEQARHLPLDQWEKQVADASHTIESQLAVGDYFLCASERQRHFYLGQLTTLGRVTPSGYADDPHLSRLLGVVPFGLPGTEPQHIRPVLRGVVPGIGKDDDVIIWSGGIYDWFDPLTLIRAVAQLSTTRPTVKLFFMGTAHPHPGVPEMPIIKASRDLASELGVAGKQVFFNDSWVDYDDRQNYLLEASLGVSTHRAHIETTFSFRTRILDYLWASLPMVVTEGDHFAEEVTRHGLGLTVPAGDVDALADAIDRVLFDVKLRARAKKALAISREKYRWSKVLGPLVEHVEGVAKGTIPGTSGKPVRYSPARPRPPRFSIHDVSRGFQRLAQGEFRSLARAIARKLRPRRS
jgi:GT2 family glycosyltransferase/glycosyltransferase involved in cell wall biosynthesis